MIVRARIARTGLQMYGRENEYRPPEEVFASKSLATFDGVPLVLGHPNEVNASNVDRLAVGYVRKPRRDGIYLGAELVIFDEGIAARVTSRELVELSVGYSTDVERGTWFIDGQEVHGIQRNIVANHVGMGPRDWARCGPGCSIAP